MPLLSVRLRAITKLGGRCVAATCRWHNEDGTVGCTDERALVFHHVDGGGSEERREGGSSRRAALEILKGSDRFQLLCGACHEIDKKEKKRAQGARQHKGPARVRRSLGQPERRVKEKPEIEHLRFLEAERSYLARKRQENQ